MSRRRFVEIAYIMRDFILLLFISVCLACNSKSSAVQEITVSEVKNLNTEQITGQWEIESFNYIEPFMTLDMNFDSTYLVFKNDSTFSFRNIPTEKAKSVISGKGIWMLNKSDKGTRLIIKTDINLTPLPLDSIYSIVTYDGVLTLRHQFKRKGVGLSFQKSGS